MTVRITTKTSSPPTMLDGGYAIAATFSVRAETEELDLVAEVAVTDGKVRTTSLTVATNDTRGVTSTTLRSVAIRDIVAEGVYHELLRVVPSADGKSARMEPASRTWSEDDVLATKRLVGYVDPRETKR
jgi:hypothetical protein